jgi:hypothetical protein
VSKSGGDLLFSKAMANLYTGIIGYGCQLLNSPYIMGILNELANFGTYLIKIDDPACSKFVSPE